MVPSQASPTPQPMMRKTMKMAAQMAIQRRICFRCGILGVVLFVIALDPMCKQKGANAQIKLNFLVTFSHI